MYFNFMKVKLLGCDYTFAYAATFVLCIVINIQEKYTFAPEEVRTSPKKTVEVAIFPI